MLRDDQSRCVGRSDLSPDSITCPKRDTCARYTDLRDRGSDFSWPKHISVYTHVCDDAALSAFVALDCGVHERNSAPAPDICEPLDRIPPLGVFSVDSSSMAGNTVSEEA